MHRTGTTLICALLAGLLVSCSPPQADPTPPEAALVLKAPADAVPAVDPAVHQRVKNLCIEQLQVQASGKAPGPTQLRPQKIRLVKVALLGGTRQITLPGGATGYELGIEYMYKMGNDDAKPGRKLCRANLADSTVEWQGLTGR
ncbi:hypothetical protein [Arthrobacter sp. EPSL27]|uniref:hypothetical protein n=1 Tax=Arthrobacter sp. EPSL27 TaxID=1745378 RepID=UPI00074A3D22|nr:hypothetical protein [Arthrobacter sp. EPSL27]KUM38319.1 hypothetical protein AR539_03615 [Arthrobacter sp. EPSL27]